MVYRERTKVWEGEGLIARRKSAEVGGRSKSPLLGQCCVQPYWGPMLRKAGKKG